MAEVHQVSHGPVPPVLAVLLSCFGCYLGLRAFAGAARARGRRFARLLPAALAVGGLGVWAAGFGLLLGVGVPGRRIAFDLPRTGLAAALAVVSAAVAFRVALLGDADARGRRRGARIGAAVAAGLLLGAGAAAAQWAGTGALRMRADVSQARVPLVAAAGIAVLGAVAALLLTSGARRAWRGRRVAAALVLAAAVCGSDAAAGAGLRVRPRPAGDGTVPGTSAGDLLLPLVLGVCLVSVVLLFVVALAPGEDEVGDGEAARPAGRSDPAGADPSGTTPPSPGGASPAEPSPGGAGGPPPRGPGRGRPRIDPDTGRATGRVGGRTGTARRR